MSRQDIDPEGTVNSKKLAVRLTIINKNENGQLEIKEAGKIRPFGEFELMRNTNSPDLVNVIKAYDNEREIGE